MKKKKINTSGGGLLYLSQDVLLTHPKNLRRFYPENQVREMADSIRAAKGVLQALRVVANGRKGKYCVVDGNMRLAGARALGKDCPPLKCEIVKESEVEQLLAMLVTAKIRYDPDPISEALHYKRLIEEEGYTASDIKGATGVCLKTIDTRRKLLELDPEIQELVGNHRLPSDFRATEAFLSIKNSKARVKLAERLARAGSTVKAIVASCQRLVARMEAHARVEHKGAPSLTLGKHRAFGKSVSPAASVPLTKVRKAAAEMCKKCDIRMKAAPEPAWTLVSHAAEDTCRECNVRDIKGSCGECPGVDIIRRLIVAVGDNRS